MPSRYLVYYFQQKEKCVYTIGEDAEIHHTIFRCKLTMEPFFFFLYSFDFSSFSIQWANSTTFCFLIFFFFSIEPRISVKSSWLFFYLFTNDLNEWLGEICSYFLRDRRDLSTHIVQKCFVCMNRNRRWTHIDWQIVFAFHSKRWITM